MDALLEETQKAIAVFQSSRTETARIDAHEKALRLAQTLEQPRTAILKLSYSPMIPMAMKVAHDLGIFAALEGATTPVPLATLSAGKQANPLLVERFMRLLAANSIVDEPVPCKYLPTAISQELTKQASTGMLESLFLEFLPIVQKTPQYLHDTDYRNPDDPFRAPLQYTHNVDVDGFSWLCQNPDALSRFNAFMEGQRADRSFWGDWFPVRERILTLEDGTALEALNGDNNPSAPPLLVDVGGGRGHDLLAFRERFPEPMAPGQLVLEDLPGVLDEARAGQGSGSELEARGIAAVPYDFFAEEQPVKNARVYYFKYVLHDWSDEKAAVIFRNLRPAMKPGFSRVLIEEYILPDLGSRSLPCMTDMAVMVFCSGLERTKYRWVRLLEGIAGLKVLKFWMREGDGLGIIEAELPL